MPAPVVKTSNSISRYGIPGWYSRLIYIYNGFVDDTISSEEEGFGFIQSNYPDYKKGSHIWSNEFANSFSSTNTCIQWEFEGSGYISGSADETFNMSFGLRNGANDTITWEQNDGVDHLMPKGLEVPFQFKFNLTHGSGNLFQGSGYYQYWNGDGGIVYNPIYDSRIRNYANLDIEKPMRFRFNIVAPRASLQYLTIKEFGT